MLSHPFAKCANGTRLFACMRFVVSQVPKSQGVQFHDTLYTLFLEIFYTSVRAEVGSGWKIEFAEIMKERFDNRLFRFGAR